MRILSPKRCLSTVALMILGFSAEFAGQRTSSAISKTDALKNVRMLNVPGWREAISDQGRFRVLFPGEPELNNDVISVKELRFARDGVWWVASYSDLPRPVAPDELQQLYHQGIQALVKPGTRLVSVRDLSLNGRLGNEAVFESRGEVNYLRSYISGARLYILSVNRKRSAKFTERLPDEVQNFFDSFIYWD